MLDTQRPLHLLDPALQRRHGAMLLVHLVVVALLQRGHDAGEPVVGVGGGLGNARDDQRGAGLVDEDRVDLVHDAEGVAALHAVVQSHSHVVAQVVEPELGVGAVGDVGGVGLPALVLGHHRADHAHAQAEGLVHGGHPLGVAPCQVVVHRHQVHALAGERVQRHRGGGREGLALTGLHLGDAPLVKHHRAHQLDVVVAHAESAPRCLAHQGEGLVEHLVGGGAISQPRPDRVGAFAQTGVGEILHPGLQRVDALHPLDALLHPAPLAEAQDLVDQLRAHAGVSERPLTGISSVPMRPAPTPLPVSRPTRCAPADPPT